LKKSCFYYFTYIELVRSWNYDTMSIRRLGMGFKEINLNQRKPLRELA